MPKLLFTLLITLLLTGCAAWFPPTTANTSVNKTDHSKTISTAPQFIECVRMPPCAYVAYTWTSTRPEESLLLFIMDDLQSAANGYRSIASINLNIDGDIVELQPSKSSTDTFSSDDIYVKTHRSYKASLALLKRIEQSENTVIVIVTDVGIIETDFNESRAYLGLVNFNKQVLTNKFNE